MTACTRIRKAYAGFAQRSEAKPGKVGYADRRAGAPILVIHKDRDR